VVPAEVADQRGKLLGVRELPAKQAGEDKLVQNVPGGPDSFLII